MKIVNIENLNEIVVFCLIFSILDNYQEVINWMNEKQKYLGYESVFDLLRSGRGKKAISYAEWLIHR